MDWVSGVLMGVRKEAVLDVGLMDEKFFLYWEDADWCTRFRHQEWKVIYYPLARATHSIGGSTDKSACALYRKYSIKKWKCFIGEGYADSPT